MKEDVSNRWSSPCFEYNKGIRVGGPFDGKEHSVLFFPGDYLEVEHVFSRKFPEGAIYHWIQVPPPQGWGIAQATESDEHEAS